MITLNVKPEKVCCEVERCGATPKTGFQALITQNPEAPRKEKRWRCEKHNERELPLALQVNMAYTQLDIWMNKGFRIN